MKGMAFLAVLIVAGWIAAVPATANAQVRDCTNGCYVSTCSNGNCTVWYCDSSGCKIVGSYRQQKSVIPIESTPDTAFNQPSAFAKVCDFNAGDVCPIQTCRQDACTVSVFDGKRFVPLTQTENLDTLIQRVKP